MANLTKGERDLLIAIDNGVARSFHRSVTERAEHDGLVTWVGGWRIVGCNSFSSNRFYLTEAGHAALAPKRGGRAA